MSRYDKIVWIVGHVVNDPNWEFCGVFTTEELAIGECLDEDYFIGPATINMSLPVESCDWPGAYYPHMLRRVRSTNKPLH